MPQIKLYYKGTQPHRFIVGRKVDHDKLGNARIVDAGREITLLPAARLPADGQHQPVDAADWKALKEGRLSGPVIRDMMKRGDLVEYPAAG